MFQSSNTCSVVEIKQKKVPLSDLGAAHMPDSKRGCHAAFSSLTHVRIGWKFKISTRFKLETPSTLPFDQHARCRAEGEWCILLLSGMDLQSDLPYSSGALRTSAINTLFCFLYKLLHFCFWQLTEYGPDWWGGSDRGEWDFWGWDGGGRLMSCLGLYK